MRKTIAIIATAMLALAGCSSSGDDGGATTTAEPQAAPSEQAETPAQETEEPPVKPTPTPTPEAHPTNAADRISAFGESYAWNTGVEVTVSPLRAFEPGEYASFEDAPAYIAYDVTILNNSEDVFDAATYYATLLSGGREGSQVFDTDQGVDYPTAQVLPGQSVTFTDAWGVQDPADITLSIAPSFDYMEWHWQGGL
ncbi:hypothetical protein [Jiangella mangrovi]|uniref:DUF4352 domain-containing protein n=1 Tax=Jiangella mangrovi TaxID=1524084 RepID=A0A7W9LJG2_9ACTN|nr:hypothetical protein [Jiangella mangrovi]MBB5785997.1 hypothetical protein [Jiangella mangrovi]